MLQQRHELERDSSPAKFQMRPQPQPPLLIIVLVRPRSRGPSNVVPCLLPNRNGEVINACRAKWLKLWYYGYTAIENYYSQYMRYILISNYGCIVEVLEWLYLHMHRCSDTLKNEWVCYKKFKKCSQQRNNLKKRGTPHTNWFRIEQKFSIENKTRKVLSKGCLGGSVG